MFFFNHPKYKQHRQNLRNESPSPERVLWQRLQKRRFLGLKFRRQYGIGRYVADFYCPELRLVIEVDGKNHEKNPQKEYDEEREQFMLHWNIQTFRVSAKDVRENISAVMKDIEEGVKTYHPCLPCL